MESRGFYGLCKVVHNAPMTETSTKNIRLTITVTPEVHETFQRFAKAASMPLGRAMGEWLGDTIEAASWTAKKMEDARAAPSLVARELHAYALGMADEAGALIKKMQEDGKAARAVGDASRPRPTVAPALHPPSSNTGGKGTKHKPKARGSKS